MGDDRRNYPRFKNTTFVQVKAGLWSPTVDSMLKDVSVGGISFFCEKKLRVGQQVTLKIYYDVKTPSRLRKGRVVWSSPAQEKGMSGYWYGATFKRRA